MAQTKARSSRSSSTSSRSKSSRSSGSNGSSARKGSSTRKTASGARSSSRSRSGSQSKQRQTSAGQSKQSQSKIATVAEKAKGPALAGGAALVGLAGGMAVSRKRKRSGVLGRISTPKVKMPKLGSPDLPKPGTVVKAVGHAAGQVADRSQRLGQIASEVQKASDAISDGKGS